MFSGGSSGEMRGVVQSENEGEFYLTGIYFGPSPVDMLPVPKGATDIFLMYSVLSDSI
jgi:hypothetical protein